MQVDTPEALEEEQVVYALVVPVSVAANVGTTPATPTLLASFNVIVTVEVATPLAMIEVVPVIVELAAETAPGANTTVPPIVVTGVAMLKILVSAVVEARVQVETPEELEAEHAVVMLLLPVAEKMGV